ncbi:MULTISPECIES: alkyl/aryl-sulfatase [Pseudacidovorax]|uniref:alkyl/aryl-sulfatase n=1 Tax=Pseudacidovorax TaxID=433923 RepID=UPI001F410AF2|nr:MULTISPECIES: alkyl sulfatase dimerization domain-containing protein [Pseudacidovorax]
MKTAYGPTLDLQRLAAAGAPPEDGEDFDDARRGFLGSDDEAEVAGVSGAPVWSLRPYAFLDDETPAPTVNPALWRQARLNRIHGLFQVTPRIFQVRGYDLANITFIEGDEGLIALDALTVPETAAAALRLYRRLRDPEGRRPLHTVIYSHSHSDHFGGVAGLVSQKDVDAGRVQVIAPVGFMHHAVAENVIGGVAMARRAQFQFGHTLPVGADGQVDAGLGKSLPRGRPSLIAPTWEIVQDVEAHTIDGVAIEFQLAPDTEAPAEMHFYFPGERALNLAENATRTLHNLCPLRGAKVRDSLAWSKYLHEALQRWGDRSDVALAQHHWPTWGQDRVQGFLREQRDLYRWLHDQTVRLMSHGLKSAEIAEGLTMPGPLARRWHARGFYGTVSHNVKAIYQHYLSWYDAHPANLHAHPPVAAAERYVRYMGGIDALVERAREDLDRGDYRWVAEVMKHAVYAHPDHAGARALAAEALEQMGFAAESATWRNAFLLGAREYREGPPAAPAVPGGSAMLAALGNGLLFDALAVRLNAPRAGELACVVGLHLVDSGEHWRLELSNGALSPIRVPSAEAPCDVHLTLPRRALNALLARQQTLPELVGAGEAQLRGDASLLPRFFGLLDNFSGSFPVVDAARWPD